MGDQSMTIKLIATDLDGTLLDDHGDYDRSRFARVYAALRQQGITFAVASGHFAREIAPLFEQYPDIWLIGSNGAELAKATGEVALKTFSIQTLTQIRQALAAYDELQVVLCSDQAVYTTENHSPRIAARLRESYPQLNMVAQLADVTAPIIRVDLHCTPGQTAQCAYELKPKLAGIATPVAMASDMLSLVQPGVHKGTALRALGHRLNVSPAEMLAFGDGTNDLEMLHAVKNAVAVHNAPKNVQANAAAVTGTNNDGGVLRYLEQHFLA